MSVERTAGYHSHDRIVHVTSDGEHILEPFGGYVPRQRLVGTAAVLSAVERWLDANPIEASADRKNAPSPPEIDETEATDPFQQAEQDAEDIEALTTKAVELAT